LSLDQRINDAWGWMKSNPKSTSQGSPEQPDTNEKAHDTWPSNVAELSFNGPEEYAGQSYSDWLINNELGVDTKNHADYVLALNPDLSYNQEYSECLRNRLNKTMSISSYEKAEQDLQTTLENNNIEAVYDDKYEQALTNWARCVASDDTRGIVNPRADSRTAIEMQELPPDCLGHVFPYI